MLRHQASYKTYLADLLAGECDEREARRKIRGQKPPASLPWSVAEFDFTANPAIAPAVAHTLASGE